VLDQQLCYKNTYENEIPIGCKESNDGPVKRVLYLKIYIEILKREFLSFLSNGLFARRDLSPGRILIDFGKR